MDESNETLETEIEQVYQEKFGKPLKWPSLDAINRFKEMLKARGEALV